jgi:type IV secretion system protein VirB10
MRLALLALSFLAIATAQSNFSGTWRLNTSLSEMRGLPAPADLFLKVEQTGAAMTVSGSSQEGGPFLSSTYPLDGSADKRKFEGSSFDTRAKWEGAALLANIIVSGPQDYAVMERWTRSRDGNTLTIRRTIVRQGNERESTLVYQLPAAATVTEARPAALERRAGPPDAAAPPAEYVVETGSRILLRLTNSVNTRHTVAGDRIYLETVVPFFVDGHLIIPRGSIVIGTVAEAQKAGRVKGRSSLSLRFESLTLPNGVARDFRALPDQVDGRGSVDKSEGKIEGDGNKGGDARTVGTTTAAGAGIGGVIGAASGHVGAGLGIGAAGGAAAGLAGVLGSRGPEVVLPPGTTMELVLDRDLRFTREELQRRVQN